jgi:hypothetical protein
MTGVSIHDGVEQRVEDERRSVLEQIGLPLRPRADVRQPAIDVTPHRQDIVRADEDGQLARVCAVGDDFHRMQDGEERVAVLLDFRALMAVQCVLHGERVQRELLAHI